MRTRLVLTVLVAIGATLLRVRTADATCLSPTHAIEPASGAVLPVNPVLYWFRPAGSPRRQLRVFADGKQVPFVAEPLPSVDWLTVVRIRVHLDRATSMTVAIGSVDHLRFVYRIDPSIETSPPSTAVSISRVRERVSKHLCFAERSLLLTPSVDAPAYRVEWAPTRQQVERGEARTAVLPRTRHDLWDSFDSGEPRREREIAFGQLACAGQSVPLSDLPAYVRVTALYPDGSESPPGPILRITRPFDWDAALRLGLTVGPALVLLGILVGLAYGLGRRRRARG